VALLSALLLTASACGVADDGEEARPETGVTPPGAETRAGPPVPEGVTGILGSADGRWVFRACGTEHEMAVENRSPDDLDELLAELGYGSGEVAVHLVLEGTAVLEIRVAEPEGFPCERMLPEAELRARGNEPFWAVDVGGERAVFRSPEFLEGVHYPEGSWVAGPTGWRFAAVRPAADGVAELTLWVEEGRCVDSMSGAWYPFRAEARHGGFRLTGCALEGRLAVPTPVSAVPEGSPRRESSPRR
jgi:uncharacterized membrane protein